MIIHRVVTVLSILVLGACTGAGGSSTYEKVYQANSAQAVAMPAVGQPAEIRVSEKLALDQKALQESGYVVLGQSEFTGPAEGDEGILRQAEKVGATLVLKNAVYVKTQPKLRRVYQANDGVSYVPVLATPDDPTGASPPGTEGAPNKPRYQTEDIYQHKVIFLARRT